MILEIRDRLAKARAFDPRPDDMLGEGRFRTKACMNAGRAQSCGRWCIGVLIANMIICLIVITVMRF